MASRNVFIWFGILGVFLVIGGLLFLVWDSLEEDQADLPFNKKADSSRKSAGKTPGPEKQENTRKMPGSFAPSRTTRQPGNTGGMEKPAPFVKKTSTAPAKDYGDLDDFKLSSISPTFFGIVSTADMEPIPGATVILYQDFPPPIKHKLIKRIKTDAKGKFIFSPRLVQKNVKYHIYCSYPGKVSMFCMNYINGKRLEIILRSGQPLKGKVVDTRGNPIQGARVRGLGKNWREEVRSGKKGEFVFPLAPDSELLKVTVQADGYENGEQDKVSSGEGTIEISLEAGVPVHGTVVDGTTDERIEGAVISLGLPGFSERMEKARTDEKGKYTIPGMPLMFATFFAKAPGYSEFMLSVKIEKKESLQYDFKLYPTGSIKGRVVDSQENPVEGAKIFVGVKHVFVYYVPDPTKVEAVTHSDGTFHLSEINTSPKFDCKLVAVHPDYLRGESIVVKPKPGETLEGITIKLKDGLFFRGSVQDQSGKPIAGATIKVTFFGNQAIRTVYFGNLLTPIPRDTTDEKGQFNITQMTAGRARVEVTAEDYISLQEMIEVPESGGIEGKVFKMEKGYSISGRVMNAAGKGIGNVRLHASCPHPVSSYSNALTNQEGYYKVTNLKQGIFSLTARMSGYAQAVKEGVQSGELKADFILHENGKLSGMVTSAIDGGPVKEFHINLQTRKGDGTYQWYRDFSHNVKDGKYTCADIEPGVYKVTVRSKEFASKSYDGVTITTGGETTGINFVLSAGCIIFGKVTDAMGSLVKDVHVTAQPLDNRGNPDYQGQSRTDRVKKNGNYRIRGLKSGIYMVKPMAGGYCQSPGQRVQVGGDQAFQVDLILNKGGYISVKVVDARRQPVANAHVLITDSGGNKWGAVTEQYHTPGGGTHMDPVHARVAGEEAGGGGDIATGGGDGMAAGGFGNRTGMTGEFKLAQPLCPGPAVVKVTSPGYQPKERKVTIVDEQQIQCRIVLRK